MNNVQRAMWGELRFVELAGEAILRRHPQTPWLIRHAHAWDTGLSNDELARGIAWLETWLRDHGWQG